MSFNNFLIKPQSKKITLIEIDSPIVGPWQNYEPGIWFQLLTPGKGQLDAEGAFYTWGDENEVYYNIGSVNVQGEIYTEATTLNNCIATEKSWFYDTATTYIYCHFEDWNPPEFVTIRSPGAVIGFTNQVDTTTNNYFEDVYYEPLVKSVPNMTKKKDPLFFGLMQYQGGTISFINTGGYFDDFAQRDLYGQPVRIRLSFEGLAYDESLLVYNGKVEDFTHDFQTFKLKIADVRKLLSRKLPINVLADGTPKPLIYGSVINVPAYRISAGNWTFADTTFNSIDSGITVVDKDGVSFSHGGTETDGTFTGADTTDKLYVTCSQTTVQNGLDIIADILENYENVTYNSTNYDTVEWTKEKNSAKNAGIWIGKGNLMSSVDVIELICTQENGVFDVLADGRFTFRKYSKTRTPVYEFYEDELIDDPAISYDSDEYLSSVKVEYLNDWLEKEPEIYTNSDFEAEVFGRYRQYKERTFETALTTEADAITLTNSIMELSKFIFPNIGLNTKTQVIENRILDNVIYTYARQNGTNVLERSRFQVLGITLDLASYEISTTIKLIEEDDSTINQMVLGETGTDMVLGETGTDMVLGIPYWTQGV